MLSTTSHLIVRANTLCVDQIGFRPSLHFRPSFRTPACTTTPTSETTGIIATLVSTVPRDIEGDQTCLWSCLNAGIDFAAPVLCWIDTGCISCWLKMIENLLLVNETEPVDSILSWTLYFRVTKKNNWEEKWDLNEPHSDQLEWKRLFLSSEIYHCWLVFGPGWEHLLLSLSRSNHISTVGNRAQRIIR